MTLSDGITVIAILLAPLFAIQASRWLSLIAEMKRRRLEIFRTLMTTRGQRLSANHVNALNLIDIDFRKRKDEKVVDKWKSYYDHLGDTRFVDGQVDAWLRKGDDLLTSLLYEMSKVLRYRFSEVVIKRGCYIPKAYGDDENQVIELRKLLLDILNGKNPFPVELVGNATDEGESLIKKSIDYYEKLISGDLVQKIEIVEKDNTPEERANGNDKQKEK